jgi:hypothetical protein
VTLYENAFFIIFFSSNPITYAGYFLAAVVIFDKYVLNPPVVEPRQNTKEVLAFYVLLVKCKTSCTSF